MLETMIEHNHRTKKPLSKEKLRQAMNTNNATIETFIQSPVTTNTPRNKIDVSIERSISSDSLTETLKGFNRLTLQSTIIDS